MFEGDYKKVIATFSLQKIDQNPSSLEINSQLKISYVV